MSDKLYISVKDFYFKIVRFCVGDTDVEYFILHHKDKKVKFWFGEYGGGWQHEEPFFQLLETCEVDLYSLSAKKKFLNNYCTIEYHIWLKPVDEKTWKKLIHYAKKSKGVDICLN